MQVWDVVANAQLKSLIRKWYIVHAMEEERSGKDEVCRSPGEVEELCIVMISEVPNRDF